MLPVIKFVLSLFVFTILFVYLVVDKIIEYKKKKKELLKESKGILHISKVRFRSLRELHERRISSLDDIDKSETAAKIVKKSSKRTKKIK